MQCCFWNLQEAGIIASAAHSFAINLFCFISIAEFFATNRFCCIIFCDDVMGLKGRGERAGRTGFAVGLKGRGERAGRTGFAVLNRKR
jgi:hypothetical protein